MRTTPRDALLYSFGVGEDISFDIRAIEHFACRVYAFDPTPKCTAWIAAQQLPIGFNFRAVGVAATDGDGEFAPPTNQTHVSFSSVRGSDRDFSDDIITAPVKRMTTHIRELGHETPDIIKMDIEGFEYEVISDMLNSGVLPGQFLVEFHHEMYGFSQQDTIKAVQALRLAGYELFYVSSSGREYGFCR